MYYNNRNRAGGSSYNQNRSFGARRGFGAVRKIKYFDPTNIVSLPKAEGTEPDYTIKHQFKDFKISDRLKENIAQRDYNSPTPIQDMSIPAILEGRDVIGMANTGTGKTAAFLIPLIEKASRDRNLKILIFTPTRELASQINTELKSYSSGLNIHSVLCIGGVNIWHQKSELRRGPNFVIGTPGRLEDLVKTKDLKLSVFNIVVLDEADRMVDIGFIENIKRMIAQLPRSRQSLFFSATVSGKVKDILTSFVTNPVTVSVKSQDITTQVKQEIVKIITPNTKIDMLEKILKNEEYEKILIFARTKRGVQKLSDTLSKRGYKADAIHGNKNQNQRTRTLDKFRKDYIQILIATDVASRGLDIPNVSHVINYDLPESYESYIHRIGRTGRANNTGVALTFVE